MSHIALKGLTDGLIRGLDQSIDTVKRNHFLITRESNCQRSQVGRIAMSPTRNNGSSKKSCPRNKSQPPREKYSYHAVITVLYWNFLVKTGFTMQNYSILKYTQLFLEKSGYLSITRSKATPAENVFALWLHLIIDAEWVPERT